MTRKTVIITRTEPGATLFAARLHALGYHTVISSLLDIVATQLPCPVLWPEAQGILITSSNALLFLSADVPKDLPLYAVGDATAQAARDAGFQNVTAGGGEVAALAQAVRALNPQGTWLHIGGEELAAGTKDLFATIGCQVAFWPVYRSVTAAIDPTVFTETQGSFFVTLHSPKAARVFAELIAPYGRTFIGKMNLLCLSQAVLGSLPEAFPAHTYVAATPDENALLTLLEIADV